MTDPHVSRILPTNLQAIRQMQEANETLAQQVESADDLEQFFELSAFNPIVQAQRFRDFERLKLDTQKEKQVSKPEEHKILAVEKMEEVASRFQKNNEELRARTLLILRSRIKDTDTSEEILAKVLDTYPDPSLADEALDFLLETSSPDLLPLIRSAKEQLNSTRQREIVAGRNMGAQARTFSKEGLGSPTSLRDLYRDITGKTREPVQLFEELTEKFSFAKLKPAIFFLLHALGSDLRAKGPSISRPELQHLIDETRSLQGILGIFRFFQSRMHLIQQLFLSQHLTFPPRLTFEILAKLFVKILLERYMNADRILHTAIVLGVSEELAAQIILFNQMRDAIKQIAPRYYRSMQHRDELIKAFIDAIESLEDRLEEEEEEEK